MIRPTATANEWRAGAPVVAAGVLGLVLSTLHIGPLGVLMTPLSEIFGWTRSQIATGQMIITFYTFGIGPVIGLLLPRLGSLKIVMPATVIFAIGYIMLGLCSADISSWYIGWIVTGIGYVGISPLIWTAAVTRSFTRHRGLALSLTLSGTGISAFGSPLITAYVLEHYSWRLSFFLFAGFTLVIALPLLWWLMRGRPEFAPISTRMAAESPTKLGRPYDQTANILTNRRAWLLVAASLLIASSVGILSLHIQAIMQDAGASATAAATYFAVMGPTLIIGRIGAGILLDRLAPRAVSAMLFMLPAIVCLILLHYDGSAMWGVTACIFFGLGFGAETDVLAYLTSRYFTVQQYPLIYSMVYGVFSLGYGIASVIGGAVFDRFGSYDPILIVLITGVAVGAMLILALGKPLPRAAIDHLEH